MSKKHAELSVNSSITLTRYLWDSFREIENSNNLRAKSELVFENEVVEYLTKIGGVKQWEYEKSIKTTDQLWNNFKAILESNNRDKLDGPLTESEFKQLKNRISSLNTPYKAGQFLYGTNGVSEIDIELENGETKFLTVFDQAQVRGGNTRY